MIETKKRTKMKIYKKYLTMNPITASNLYLDGKISYKKYQMAFYSGYINEDALRKLIYG
jgi:hypothetical protein